MKKFIVPLMLAAMAGFVPGTGCQHCQKPCPPAPPPLARGSAFLVPPVDRSIPAGPVFAPQTGFQTPAAPPAGSDIRTYPPPLAVPAQPSWGPPSSSGARLLAPEFGTQEPPLNTEKKPNVAESTSPAKPNQPGAGQASASPVLPVEIPGFASAREQVSSGRKPFAEGFDYLKRNGYVAVLYIHEPGEDDSADKREAEQRGLKYFTVEVSAKTLGQPVVEQFNRLVGEAGNRPLFVYDRSGQLAGALWYLHFRTVEQMSDEAAREKATALGLKTQKENLNQPIWLAIQKYLSEQAP
ncbi:MAG TPA: hypothetical protein VGY66_20735 [Gemmataceae bacterium]|jgi:protein tyrosine phosphatase (PTP) superfamily phosphohydrolase (DUF442 family)|nr:hypothetical protein [Gemmataceae bacterium]